MIFDLVAVIFERLLGIKLERQTDLIALTALLLAILTAGGSASYIFYGYMKGAKVDMYLYEQIVLKAFEMDGRKYLRLGGSVVFSNSGQVGYDTVVKQVMIALKFQDNSEHKQRWQEFVSFTNKGGKIEEKDTAEAVVPVQIRAGSVLSRDIYFAPFRERCRDDGEECSDEWRNYLGWDDFIKKLRVGEDVEFTVTAESFKNEKWSLSCAVKIDRHIIDKLRSSDGHAPSCLLDGRGGM